MQRLAAAVAGQRFDPDQPIPLQRKDVAAQRRAIHHHIGCKRIDGHWPLSLQLGQNGKLRGAQSGRCEKLVIGRSHVARRLAHREAHAAPRMGWGIGAHRVFGSTRLNEYMRVNKRICT
jgi:hypothetical protein